ncbi:MAG: integrase/recombinase XerD [bacterium]|nr:MAG: integrase/recombinase XerD [bacterium]
MRELIPVYLLQLQAKNYSPSTLKQRNRAVEKLIFYLETHLKLTSFNEVTKKDLEGFSLWLEKDYLKTSSELISKGSLKQWLSCIKKFFSWMSQQKTILANPAEHLSLPVLKSKLTNLLTQKQVSDLIEQADPNTTIGLRDRALMETLYATGIRHMEAHNLDLYDIDTREQILMVREGKGMKSRLLPLTENSCFWLDKYLIDSRPLLAFGLKGQKPKKDSKVRPISNALFLSGRGARFSYIMIGQIIRQYAIKTNLKANPHTFRHCFASHLLKAGADVQHLKRLLGHSSLDDTQLYLHLTNDDLGNSIKRFALDEE